MTDPAVSSVLQSQLQAGSAAVDRLEGLLGEHSEQPLSVVVSNQSLSVSALLLPEVQRLSRSSAQSRNFPYQCLFLASTRQRAQQVAGLAANLYAASKAKCTLLSGEGKELRDAILQAGQLVVTTPGRLCEVLKAGMLRRELWRAQGTRPGLRTLILDAADTMLAMPGYQADLATLAPLVPETAQCVISVGKPSADALAADSWLVTTLLRGRVPRQVQLDSNFLQPGQAAGLSSDVLASAEALQGPFTFALRCSKQDRLLVSMALLKLGALRKKSLVFVSAASYAVRLRLLLSAFGLRAVVLEGSQPLNSRLRAVQEFNIALVDYLIVSDDGLGHLGGSAPDGEDAADDEAGSREGEEEVAAGGRERRRRDERRLASSGCSLRGVNSVVHVDTACSADYARRTACLDEAESSSGRTEVVLQPPDSEANAKQGADQWLCSLPSFSGLTSEAIERLRYRTEDVARSLTPAAVREARAKELQAELLSSERLKEHFRLHPGDLSVLKATKHRAKGVSEPAPHIKHLPAYLRAKGGVQKQRAAAQSSAGQKVKPVNPFGLSRKGRRGGDLDNELTEIEKVAIASAPKQKKRDRSDVFNPKGNVRKGKSRKR